MYNDIVAPILSNPRFTLAKKPSYVPIFTEFHQVYVITRMIGIYSSAKISNVRGFKRLEKVYQYPVFHVLELRPLKKLKNCINVSVSAIIMAVLVDHLSRSLGGREVFRICLSYAFEDMRRCNNYSFVVIEVREGRGIEEMAR